MNIQVEENPNCRGSDQFVFNELEAPAPVKGIRVADRGKESWCDVVGVDGPGRFTDAFAVKVTDSGAGFAYLIYGGGWGIRLRPEAYAGEPWGLSNTHQWGESFKLYGEKEDILYGNFKTSF